MSYPSERILFVDDEPTALHGLCQQLQGRFRVTYAVGHEAGLQALEQQGPFAVVVSDYMLAGESGRDFLQRVHEICPAAVAVMLTACNDIQVAVRALHEGRVFRFLIKPCSEEVFEAALRDSIAQHRLIASERSLTVALQEANARLERMNAELEDRVRERTVMVARLYEFVSQLTGEETVDGVAELTVAMAAELLRSRRVSLMLPDASGEYLYVAAAVGLAPEIQARIRVPVGAAIAGEVFAQQQAIVMNSPDPGQSGQPRYDSDFFAVWPLASTALHQGARGIGVLNVTEPWSGRPYTPEDLATLQAVAEAASVALLNQIRLRERNEARDAVILALAKLAENRDPETGAHLERVQQYCRLLSEGLARTPKYVGQISADFITAMFRSSPLHDIGKVGIPDCILLKPGRLSPAEFEIMKTHTTIGASTIGALLPHHGRQEFLRVGMEIALNHHERYDGSGYPAGLAGERIPLSARVMAVADMYDALRSRRVYKPAMSHEESLALIQAGSGRHFDPDVVAVFLELQGEFDRLARELADVSQVTTPADALEAAMVVTHGAGF